VNSAKLFELISALCVRLEFEYPELILSVRASWNTDYGSLDGDLAYQILGHLKNILPSFDDNIKRKAYNELADLEGLDRIEADEDDFDSWVCEAFLDLVINMLIKIKGSDSIDFDI